MATSVISSTVPFKIVLQKGSTVDFEKSQVWLFGKSGSRKNKQLLLALELNSWQVAPQSLHN